MKYLKVLAEYRAYMTGIKAVRESSARAYIYHLKRFFKPIAVNGALPDLSEADLAKILSDLRGKRSVNTRRIMTTALKGFYKWLSERYGVNNPAENLAPIKEWRGSKDVLHIDDVERMIVAAGKDNIVMLRNAAIISLLADTGVRVGELINLRVRDVQWEYSQQMVLMVQPGKGSRGRMIPFCYLQEGSLVAETFSYYFARVKFQLGWSGDDWLFQRHTTKMVRDGEGWREGAELGFDPGPLSAVAVWNMLRRVGRAAGVSRDVNPHAFRHFYATYLAMNKVQPMIIMQRLGHASLDRTMIYVHQADVLSGESSADNPLAKSQAGWEGGVKALKALRGINKQGVKEK